MPRYVHHVSYVEQVFKNAKDGTMGRLAGSNEQEQISIVRRSKQHRVQAQA
jgi:hypothetical protein